VEEAVDAVTAVAADDGVAVGTGVLLDHVPDLSELHAGLH